MTKLVGKCIRCDGEGTIDRDINRTIKCPRCDGTGKEIFEVIEYDPK